MENYARILEALEKNMEKVQLEKETAIKEKLSAVEEMNTIRRKYVNVLGSENYTSTKATLSEHNS